MPKKDETTRTMRSFRDGVSRSIRATEIMGKEGRAEQVARNRKARTPKEKTIETVRRVGEYRAAKADKVIDKVKRYKNPGNK